MTDDYADYGAEKAAEDEAKMALPPKEAHQAAAELVRQKVAELEAAMDAAVELGLRVEAETLPVARLDTGTYQRLLIEVLKPL